MSRLQRLLDAHPCLTESGGRMLLVKRGMKLMNSGEYRSWNQSQKHLDDYAERICSMTSEEVRLKVLRLTEFMDVAYSELIQHG